jgi:hypothetical protein
MKTTRKLPVQLTDDELQQRSQALVGNIKQTDALKEEKKTATSEFKARIGACNDVTKRLTEIISSGKEERDVECEMTKDYKGGTVTVVRLDTGEVVETRPMTADERQESMWTQKGEPRAPARGRGKKLPGMDSDEDESGDRA